MVVGYCRKRKGEGVDWAGHMVGPAGLPSRARKGAKRADREVTEWAGLGRWTRKIERNRENETLSFVQSHSAVLLKLKSF